jgi:hypothetical protein
VRCRRTPEATPPDQVLHIRRSRRKAVVWTVMALVLVLSAIWYGLKAGAPGKVIAAIGVLLFGSGALMLAREALSPRDLLMVSPDGIDQRAVSPHAMIPWNEIADIQVIERAHRVKTLGVTVRHPELLPRRGQLGRVERSPWLGRGVKAGLAVLVIGAEGPSGIKDAVDAVREDTELHATFEIPTVALELGPDELVSELRHRWVAAGGQPLPRERQ